MNTHVIRFDYKLLKYCKGEHRNAAWCCSNSFLFAWSLYCLYFEFTRLTHIMDLNPSLPTQITNQIYKQSRRQYSQCIHNVFKYLTRLKLYIINSMLSSHLCQCPFYNYTYCVQCVWSYFIHYLSWTVSLQ